MGENAMERRKKAVTYVDITREEFEDWLDSLSHKWVQKSGTRGVYLVKLSDNVGISVSSTIGFGEGTLGHGKASIKMKLVSMITGQTLNKKAQGQSHFKRTKGWAKNLGKGIKRLEDTYKKSKGFYDAIAEIEDRGAYRKDLLDTIKSVEGWENQPILSSFHDRVEKGGVLTIKQQLLLKKLVESPSEVRSPRVTVQEPSGELTTEERVDLLRQLWVAAKRGGDQWTADFAQSIGEGLKRGRGLSKRQEEILFEKLDKYDVGEKRASIVRRFLDKQAALQASRQKGEVVLMEEVLLGVKKMSGSLVARWVR